MRWKALLGSPLLPWLLLLALVSFLVVDRLGCAGRQRSQRQLDAPGTASRLLAQQLPALPAAVEQRRTSVVAPEAPTLGEAWSAAATPGVQERPVPLPPSPQPDEERRLSGGDGEEAGHQHDAMLFLFNSIILGVLTTHTLTIPQLHGLQQTVVLFVLGIAVSLLMEGAHLHESLGVLGRSYRMWMDIDPHLLLFAMLPGLLAGDAMNIDTAIARRVSKQCVFLAGPGVLINGVLTALFLWWYIDSWDFLLSMTVGAILCATDPVAVVCLLKELGAPPSLTVQIQGESLLNDGTAIVLYMLSYNALKGEQYDLSDIIVFLARTAMCAWGLGLVMGYIFHCWIAAARNTLDHHSSMVQISLSLSCAYCSFILAEGVLSMSGVLATVAAALVLADKMWPVVVSKEAMHTVWHLFEYLWNSVIFFLAGALIGKTMIRIPLEDYGHLIVIYCVTTVIRGAMLFASRPLLQRFAKPFGHDVTVADTIVMTWAGLRGAVGLALAIQVAVDRAGGELSERDADRVLFYVGGIATLTLIVNANTCPIVVRWLGIAVLPETKQRILLMIHDQLICLLNGMIEAKKSEGETHEEPLSRRHLDELEHVMERMEDQILKDVALPEEVEQPAARRLSVLSNGSRRPSIKDMKEVSDTLAKFVQEQQLNGVGDSSESGTDASHSTSRAAIPHTKHHRWMTNPSARKLTILLQRAAAINSRLSDSTVPTRRRRRVTLGPSVQIDSIVPTHSEEQLVMERRFSSASSPTASMALRERLVSLGNFGSRHSGRAGVEAPSSPPDLAAWRAEAAAAAAAGAAAEAAVEAADASPDEEEEARTTASGATEITFKAPTRQHRVAQIRAVVVRTPSSSSSGTEVGAITSCEPQRPSVETSLPETVQSVPSISGDTPNSVVKVGSSASGPKADVVQFSGDCDHVPSSASRDGMIQTDSIAVHKRRSMPMLGTMAMGAFRESLNHLKVVVQRDQQLGQHVLGELHDAKEQVAAIPKELLQHLGDLPEVPDYACNMELRNLVLSKECDPSLLWATNEALLNLVFSQYWAQIDTGDVVPGTNSAEVLLTSVKLALSNCHAQLADYEFIQLFVQVPLMNGLAFQRQSLQGPKGQERRLSKVIPEERILEHFPKSFLEDEEQPFVRQIVESTTFNGMIMLAIVSNAIFIAIEGQVRAAGNQTDGGGWLAVDIIFAAIFLLEFVIQFCDLRWRYFRDIWNIFDFCLVVLSIVSVIAKVIAEELKDSDVSTESRLVRLARVFRVLRVLRLFQMVKLWQVMKARFLNKEVSVEVAEHVQKISVLLCFIRAHVRSQQKVISYFGENCQSEVVEIAHSILQSQVLTYKALLLAVQEQERLDRAMLREVNEMKLRRQVAEDFRTFVEHAHEGGIITANEAESMFHPMKEQIKLANTKIRESHFGLVETEKGRRGGRSV